MRKCKECGRSLSKNCNGDLCNSHRDRTGKNNSFYGKTHSPATIKILKRKCATASKSLWQDKNYRKKVINGMSKPRNKAFGPEQSKRIKQWYIDNPEQKTLRSRNMKRDWQSGILVSNRFSCNKSRRETELYHRAKQVFPDAINNYVVKYGSNRRYFPDVYVPSLNLIIEYNGDYWHANPEFYRAGDVMHNNIKASKIWANDVKRTRKLEEFGYVVEVVWASEYERNPEHITRKLLGLDWESCAN